MKARVQLTVQQFEDLKKEQKFLQHETKPTPVIDYLKKYGVDANFDNVVAERVNPNYFHVWAEPGPRTLRNLSFGGALKLLKEGKKVKRKDWGGYWEFYKNPKATQVLEDGYTRGFGFQNGLIIAVLKDNGGVAPAQPYQADLLAEDWEEVE